MKATVVLRLPGFGAESIGVAPATIASRAAQSLTVPDVVKPRYALRSPTGESSQGVST